MHHARSRRTPRRLWSCLIVAAATLVLASWSLSAAGDQKDEKDKRVKGPSLALKVSPSVAFSPARVVVTAELKGGTDVDEELYCPGLEWDWGDGTVSEASEDCEPFAAGTSTIKRRWVASHTFETAGNYRVLLRLKRGSKTVVGGNTTMQVKPGVRDLTEVPQF